MTPSVYIKKHLISDIILLLVIAGTLYLIIDTWNKMTLPDKPTVEMISIDENSDIELG